MRPDLVILGNLIVDDLVFDDGSTRMGEAGGAVLYTALAAALWGVRVGLVSMAGTDYPTEVLEGLERRNVDLAGVVRLQEPGLRVWLLYEPVARRLVHRLGRLSHAAASPGAEHVPQAWREASAFHLNPAPLELQARVVADLARTSRAMLSVDPHTPVTNETLTTWRPVLASIDTFFASNEEWQLSDGAGKRWPLDAWDDARPHLDGGRLTTLLVKRGRQGGVLLSPEAASLPWAARAAAVVDPTGAGDAFAGGFLAARLNGESPAVALQHGVVSASFAIEGWGASALVAATPDAARARLRAWFG